MFLAADQWTDVSFVCVSPFHARHVRENPDIPQASRDRAAHGETAGQGGDRQDETPTVLVAEEPTILLTFQTIDETVVGVSQIGRTKRTPMSADGGTKPAIDDKLIAGFSAISWQFLRVSSAARQPFFVRAC